jgi:hypothetical protein
VQLGAVGIGISPPTVIFALSPGYCGNRGLGQDARHAIALEGLQGGAQSVGGIMRRQRCRVGKRRGRIPDAPSARDHAVDRERVKLGEGAPTGGQRACGDAELLGDIALYFRHCDLQHHLIAAAYGEHIDDPAIRARRARRAGGTPGIDLLHEALRDIAGALRVFDGIDGSGQDNRIVDRPRGDRRRRHRGAQDLLKLANIAADAELQGGDLAALLIQGKDACLAGIHADDIELARGPDDGVGDLRVGDEDFRRILGQVNNDGFAHAHRDPPRRDRAIEPGLGFFLRVNRAGRHDGEACHDSRGQNREQSFHLRISKTMRALSIGCAAGSSPA